RWNEEVVETSKRIAGAIGYRGAVDIDYRFDERDGTYKLVDMNPRLGQSFRLFVAENGLDVLRALYLDLTGQAVPSAKARNGRKWIDEPHDLLSAVMLARARTLGVRSWLRSLRGLTEAAWFARDDVVPFFSMLRLLASYRLRGIRGRAKTLAPG